MKDILKEDDNPTLWEICHKVKGLFLEEKKFICPLIAIVIEEKITIIPYPGSFRDISDKNTLLEFMLSITSNPNVEALALIAESWLKVIPRKDFKKEEVLKRSIRNDPDKEEVIVIQYSDRRGDNIMAYAKIKRNKKLGPWLFTRKSEGRFGNWFLKAMGVRSN